MRTIVETVTEKVTKSDAMVDQQELFMLFDDFLSNAATCESHVDFLSKDSKFANGLPVFIPSAFPKPEYHQGDYFLKEFCDLKDIFSEHNKKINTLAAEVINKYSEDKDEAKKHTNIEKLFNNYFNSYNTVLGGFREYLKLADEFRGYFEIGFSKMCSKVNLLKQKIKTFTYIRPLLAKYEEKEQQRCVTVLDPNHYIIYNPSLNFSEKFSAECVLSSENSIFDIKSSLSQLISVIESQGNVLLLVYGGERTGKSYCLYGDSDEYGIVYDVTLQLFRYKSSRKTDIQVGVRYCEIIDDGFFDLRTNNLSDNVDNIQCDILCNIEDIHHYNTLYKTRRQNTDEPLLIELCLQSDNQIIQKFSIIELPHQTNSLKAMEPNFLIDFKHMIDGDTIPENSLFNYINGYYSDPNSLLSFLMTLSPHKSRALETYYHSKFLSSIKPVKANSALKFAGMKNEEFETLLMQNEVKSKELEEKTNQYRLLKSQHSVIEEYIHTINAEIEKYNIQSLQLVDNTERNDKETENLKGLINQYKVLEKTLTNEINRTFIDAKGQKEVNILKIRKLTSINNRIALEKEYMEMVGEEIKAKELQLKIQEMKLLLVSK